MDRSCRKPLNRCLAGIAFDIMSLGALAGMMLKKDSPADTLKQERLEDSDVNSNKHTPS